MSSKFETSKAEGAHHLFSRMAGNWEGMAQTWFEPGKPPSDESPVTATMHLVLDGRFLFCEYKGSMQGKPLEGMMIVGKQLSTDRFQTLLIDSFHTGTDMLFSEGKRGDANLNVLGSYIYVTPEQEHVWGWRTQIELLNDNELKITAYNVEPGGEEAKATEVIYKRVK